MLITIFIFLLLTLVEFIFIWLKWNELSDAHNIGLTVSQVFGINEHYSTFANKVVTWIIKAKKFIWIPIGLILILNLLASIVAGLIISFILSLF